MKQPQRRKKPEGAVEISALLEGALKTLGVKGDYDRLQLDTRCRFILGEKLAQALVRVEQKGNVLRLEFNHPIYLQEMNFRKSEFLTRLKTELPGAGVKSLAFSLARVSRN
jgi:hypothetical protein